MKKRKRFAINKKLVSFALALSMLIPNYATVDVQETYADSGMKTSYANDARAKVEQDYPIKIPSLARDTMADNFYIVKGSRYASISGNTLTFGSEEQAAAFSLDTYDLLNENVSIAIDLQVKNTKQGVGFAFFADDGKPVKASELGKRGQGLSMYGARVLEGTALANSVAIELDRVNNISSDRKCGLAKLHTAITLPIQTLPILAANDRLDPSKNYLVHRAGQELRDSIRGNGWNFKNGHEKRMNIWWETPALTGNGKYRLRYAFYNATDNEWLKGDYHKRAEGFYDFTEEEVKSILFGSMSNAKNVRFGIFCGGKMTASLPAVRRYKINYYLANPDGTVTTTPLPDHPSKRGHLVEGVYDFIADIPKQIEGYEFYNKVNDENTYVGATGKSAPYLKPNIRYIKARELTNINYYYIPSENIAYDTNFYFEQSDGSYKLMYTDHEKGRTGAKVGPKNLGDYLQEEKVLGHVSDEDILRLEKGYDKASAVIIDGKTVNSSTGTTIKGDGSSKMDVYYKRKNNIGYTIKFEKLGGGSLGVSDYQGMGTYQADIDLSKITLPNGEKISERKITGYKLKEGEETVIHLASTEASENIFTLFYVPKTDTEYTVQYYFQRVGDWNPTGTGADIVNKENIGGYYRDGEWEKIGGVGEKEYRKISEYKESLDKPDVTVTLTGTTGEPITSLPELATADFPKTLEPNGVNVVPAAFSIDPNYKYTQTQIAADGSTVIKVHYKAKRYPFYVEYWLKSNGAPVLYKRTMPGEREFGTYREIFNKPEIAGYSFDASDSRNVISGRVKVGQEMDTYDSSFTGLVLRAYYTANDDTPYIIHYKLEDGTVLAPSRDMKGTTDSKITKLSVESPAEVKKALEGYHFVEFKNKANETVANPVIGGDGKTELTAIYAPNTNTRYTIKYYKAKELIRTVTTAAGTTMTAATAKTAFADLGAYPEIVALKADGYTYNANISTDGDVNIKGDGSTVVDVYYDKTGDLTYTIKYYLQKSDGTYSLAANESIADKGNAGEEKVFVAKEFQGYTYDESSADNISSVTLVANDNSKILKGYYTANTDTPYKINIYIEELDANGVVKNKKFIKTIEKSGRTGAKVGENGSGINASNMNNIYTKAGYSVDIENGDAVIAGNGQTVVSLIYTPEPVSYTIYHYREYRQDIYPPSVAAPSKIDIDYLPSNTSNAVANISFTNPLSETKTGYVGDSISWGGDQSSPILANNPANALYNSGGEYGKYFVGFNAVTSQGEQDIVLGAEPDKNKLHIYYKAPANRKYKIRHYKNSVAPANRIGDSEGIDAITGATIKTANYLKHIDGYSTEHRTETLSIEGGSGAYTIMYNPHTKRAIYPYLPLDFAGDVVLDIVYPAKEEKYRVEHFIPTRKDGENITYNEAKPDLVENFKALTDTSVTAIAKNTGKFKGLVVNTGKTTSLSATVNGDGSTVISIYYKPSDTTRAPYVQEYFLEKYEKGSAEGVYSESPDSLIKLEGEPFTVATNSKSFEGYTLDTNKSDGADKIIKPDGTTLYKYYYEANTDTKYTVEVYEQNIDDDEYTVKHSDDTAKATTGTIPDKESIMSLVPAEYKNADSGFVLDAKKTDLSATIKADGSTVYKVYLDRKDVYYKVVYRCKGEEIIPAYIATARFGKTVDIKESDKQMVPDEDNVGSEKEVNIIRDDLKDYKKTSTAPYTTTLSSVQEDEKNITGNIIYVDYRKLPADKTELKEEIDKADPIVDEIDKKDEDDKTVPETDLEDSLENGKKVDADEDAIQNEVDEAAEDLADKMKALEDADEIDRLRKELKDLIDEAEKISPAKSPLKNAIKYAKLTHDKIDASKEELEKEIKNLKDKMAGNSSSSGENSGGSSDEGSSNGSSNSDSSGGSSDDDVSGGDIVVPDKKTDKPDAEASTSETKTSQSASTETSQTSTVEASTSKLSESTAAVTSSSQAEATTSNANVPVIQPTTKPSTPPVRVVVNKQVAPVKITAELIPEEAVLYIKFPDSTGEVYEIDDLEQVPEGYVPFKTVLDSGEEVFIFEEDIPEGGMPKTGGIPLGVFVFFGGLMIAFGFIIRRKAV